MTSRLAAASALAGVVLAAATVWGVLGQQIDVPTVFGDELIHWDASRSIADGKGLRVRDDGYGFGPTYPALVAPVHLLVGSDLEAYRWVRLLNAVLFALAALPGYALARRLLPPGWSLGCAALAVAIPSALYTGFVMTEGAAYAACTLALLACARCLERPTVPVQLLALGSIALAASVRLQLAVLGAALGAALALRALLTRGARAPTRDDLVRLWPMLVLLGGAALALAVRAAFGNPLEGYGGLWRSYDVVEIVRWTWRALAGLCIYFALVPFVVAPAALGALVHEGRTGSSAAASFVALFVAVNAALLLVVGAFSSTEFGVGFLHDRYLFYVAPLWIVAAAVWADRGFPLRPVALVLGAGLTLAMLATLPTYLLNADAGRRFDALAGGLPSQLADALGFAEPPRWSLLLVGLIAIGLAVALRRLPPWATLVPLAAVFGLNAAFAWDQRIDAARNVTFASMDDATVSWVDRAVPDGAEVATLAGGVPLEVRDALRLTEFFNGAIGPAFDLGAGYAPTLASVRVRVAGGGVVVGDTGPVASEWIVAPPELALEGDVVAEGTLAGLRLWHVQPPVRLVGGA